MHWVSRCQPGSTAGLVLYAGLGAAITTPFATIFCPVRVLNEELCLALGVLCHVIQSIILLYLKTVKWY